MATRARRPQRQRMTGWSKWLPFLVLPFCAAFFEVRLNIGIYANDGIEYELQGDFRKSSQAIQQLKSEVARLEKMANLDLLDPDLGLIEPVYDQVVVLREGGSNTPGAPSNSMNDYQLAHAGTNP